MLLPGDRRVVGAAFRNGAGSAFVLDRATGQYRRTGSHDGVYPAPAGSSVAVRDEKRPRQVGLTDVRTGKLHWYEVGRALSGPQWSPDGRRLLFTTHQVDRFGFVVLDTDGTTQTHLTNAWIGSCSDFCDFAWTRDGREVALTLSRRRDEGAPRDLARGVQLFSVADGRPTRFLSMPGRPIGPDSWSPDGTRVVVQGQREPLLVDIATGEVVNPLPAAEVVWVADDRLLYRRPYGSHDFVLADLTGRELVRQPLPRELAEREITIGRD
ncbi:hypothetical protein MRQ36_12670 [Micromonospora sp. R77]|uniref:hypothetical protein n=1 Tax=Micromonospora sp. R77 TaxID=2925836 RepID=UPI001F60F0D0|nr:hypothetical protein [Micromonospora sp. R77]MCI4063384.1 hypothetical protein [Micromonospora sp. R77]